MEVYFLDVGQATSQLLLLGGQRAIIIDCGAKTDRTLVQALSYFRIQRIVQLIVSHNHDDHVGGATSVLSTYEGRIENLLFLTDSRFSETDFWRRIEQQLHDGTLRQEQLTRLEASESAKSVYAEEGLNLRLLSPNFAENLLASSGQQPNATSAVLCLDAGKSRIVFAGDSQAAQWREIIRARGGTPIRCDVAAVPHHGGDIGDGSHDPEWLYRECLTTRYAVVSVGSNNNHGHPRAEIIRALRASGVEVMCTQITPQCHGDLESLRPGVIRPHAIGRSSPVTDLSRNDRSRNVACAGTVVVSLMPEGCRVERWETHQTAVDTMAHAAPPLCRT